MAQPRIGITRGLSASKGDGYISPTYQRYHDRVREAGGEPVDLHPALTASSNELLDRLDGVLISGGPDVDPAEYGQTPHPETDTGWKGQERDALELGLIRAAMARDVPVFAICRGQQALNVACGGPLLQHIEGDGHRAHDGGAGDSRFHDVAIAPDTKLAGMLGTRTLETNSRHHQAVLQDGVAPGLAVSALSPDGLVEGLESPAHRWVLGVQWHPERDEVKDAFRPLFDAFIQAAAQTRELHAEPV